MKDGQDSAVMHWVEEADSLPRPFEGTGLGFAVANDRNGDEVRIVEHRTKRMREHVAELTAFVDGSGRLRTDVTRNAAGRRELTEQGAHAVKVGRDVRVDLGVGALEIHIGEHGRPAVSWTREKD